jgi:hypothetical protein
MYKHLELQLYLLSLSSMLAGRADSEYGLEYFYSIQYVPTPLCLKSAASARPTIKGVSTTTGEQVRHL